MSLLDDLSNTLSPKPAARPYGLLGDFVPMPQLPAQAQADAMPSFDFSPTDKQQKNALWSSLARMGAAMLANNRGGFANALGHGLAAQQEGYQGALDRSQNDNVQQFRTSALKDDWQAKQQSRQREAGLRQALGGLDFSQPDAYQQAANLYAQAGDFEGATAARTAGGIANQKLGAPVIGVNPTTGKREYMQWSPDGTWKWSDIEAPQEVVQMDTGGQVMLRGKYETSPSATYAKQQTPDSIASTHSGNKKQEIDFTQDFNRQKAAYNVVRQARDNVVANLKLNTAIGDTSAATSIMKMLDPNSVVRESELAMAMNATGALDRLGNYAQMLTNGQRLNQQQRGEFASLANALFKSADDHMLSTARDYNKRSIDYGFSPERVLGGEFYSRLYPQQQKPAARQTPKQAAAATPPSSKVVTMADVRNLAFRNKKTVAEVQRDLQNKGFTVR